MMMTFHVKRYLTEMNMMNTKETLILKALQFKQLHVNGHNAPGHFIDQVLEQDPEQADKLTKNVCARIPLQLAQEMETIGGLLDLNKREIITLAINDFLNQAKATIEEYQVLPEGGL